MFESMTDDVRRRRLERDAQEAHPGDSPAPPRRPGSSPWLLGVLVAAVVTCGGVMLTPNSSFDALKRSFDRAKPWGGDGTFTFMQTSDDGHPARYHPCTPIRVAVNPDGAPRDHDQLVTTGLAWISEATGLTFERVGHTTVRTNHWTGYGEAPPVLIMWANSDEVPELAGDTVGIGGSTATERSGRLRYGTGMVALDRDAFDDPDLMTPAERQAVMDHELAHVVGLGHVDDYGELMNERNIGTTDFGPGDLAGLALLGPGDRTC